MSFTRQLASVFAFAVFSSAQADIINVDVNFPSSGDGSEAEPYCSIQTALASSTSSTSPVASWEVPQAVTMAAN